jgi:hypothetical protein
LPGARRRINAESASKSGAKPAGSPSIVTPTAGECDCPNTDTRTFFP